MNPGVAANSTEKKEVIPKEVKGSCVCGTCLHATCENSACGDILLGIFGLATWSPCSFELVIHLVIEFLEVLHLLSR